MSDVSGDRQGGLVTFERVQKRFGAKVVYSDLTLSIARGDVTARGVAANPRSR